MLRTQSLLVDDNLRLLRAVRPGRFFLTPTLPRDHTHGVVSPEVAWEAFARTGWANQVTATPTLVLCRYHDSTSRRQVAWVVRCVSEQEVPVPWYVPLETEGALPRPPWEIFVVINATNGIRIVDHIMRLPRTARARPRIVRTPRRASVVRH